MAIKDRILDNIRKSGLRKELTQKWKQAIEKGYLEITEPDSFARPLFVGLQAIIEQSIAEALAKGEVQSAVNIVHTPKPVNPFAKEVADSKPYTDIDDLHNDLEGDAGEVEDVVFGPDAATYVKIRRKVLEDFIQSGGVVVSAYPAGQELSEAYQANVERLSKKISVTYPASELDPAFGDDGMIFHSLELGGLVDHPVDGLNPALTGATLIVKDKEGLTTVFSLNAHQEGKANDPDIKTWRVYFGSPDNDSTIQKRSEGIKHAVDRNSEHYMLWEAISATKVQALG